MQAGGAGTDHERLFWPPARAFWICPWAAGASRGAKSGRRPTRSGAAQMLPPDQVQTETGPLKEGWGGSEAVGSRHAAPGEILDALSLPLDGGRPSQFTACDPVTMWTCARACRNAAARNARRFLDKLRADMPFPAGRLRVQGRLRARQRRLALRVLRNTRPPQRRPRRHQGVSPASSTPSDHAAHSTDRPPTSGFNH